MPIASVKQETDTQSATLLSNFTFPPLRINSALADGIGHAVDRQHVGGDAIVHAMSFCVSDDVVKGRNHDVPQPIVDLRFLPEISLPILHPFKVRSSNSAGVRQDVGN